MSIVRDILKETNVTEEQIKGFVDIWNDINNVNNKQKTKDVLIGIRNMFYRLRDKDIRSGMIEVFDENNNIMFVVFSYNKENDEWFVREIITNGKRFVGDDVDEIINSSSTIKVILSVINDIDLNVVDSEIEKINNKLKEIDEFFHIDIDEFEEHIFTIYPNIKNLYDKRNIFSDLFKRYNIDSIKYLRLPDFLKVLVENIDTYWWKIYKKYTWQVKNYMI